ncbi:MAG TPA: hypothetical protein VHM19_01930 [Polyangiales bacterium]|nr:hypothetical protein [Polyangiales bacterium]
MDAHAEDAFIARFLLRVRARCTTGHEQRLARAVAVAALDCEPELAYPWGRATESALTSMPLVLAEQRGVGRGRSAWLLAELMRWLAEGDRLERDMRPMCRGVGAERQAGAVLAA